MELKLSRVDSSSPPFLHLPLPQGLFQRGSGFASGWGSLHLCRHLGASTLQATRIVLLHPTPAPQQASFFPEMLQFGQWMSREEQGARSIPGLDAHLYPSGPARLEDAGCKTNAPRSTFKSFYQQFMTG